SYLSCPRRHPPPLLSSPTRRSSDLGCPPTRRESATWSARSCPDHRLFGFRRGRAPGWRCRGSRSSGLDSPHKASTLGVEGPRPGEPPGGGAPGSLIRRGRALAARRPCGRTVPGRSSLLGERDAGEPVPRLARFALLGVRAVLVNHHRARSSVSQVERHRGLRLPVTGRIGGEVQPDLVLRVGVRRVDRRLLRVLLVLEVRTRVVTRLAALVRVDVRAVLTVRN